MEPWIEEALADPKWFLGITVPLLVSLVGGSFLLGGWYFSHRHVKDELHAMGAHVRALERDVGRAVALHRKHEVAPDPDGGRSA